MYLGGSPGRFEVAWAISVAIFVRVALERMTKFIRPKASQCWTTSTHMIILSTALMCYNSLQYYAFLGLYTRVFDRPVR